VFVGVAAFIGHLFPVFFRFKGGKGVATAAGVLLAYDPVLGAMTLATWVLVALIFRLSSLASLLAACFAPFYAMMFFERPAMSLGVTVMSLLLIWRHWRNILKLLKGAEPRIGEKVEPVDPNKKRRRRRKVKRLHDEVAPGPDSRTPRA
jgi:glycerol-3-phosphate acyltransferase PlsY